MLEDVFRYVCGQNSKKWLGNRQKIVNKNNAISVVEIIAYECIVQEGREIAGIYKIIFKTIHLKLEYSDLYASIFYE